MSPVAKQRDFAEELRTVAAERQLHPGVGAKIVGKLNFANQLARGRFGGLFLRLSIHCIHAPLPDYYDMSWTARVFCWWIEVLEEEATEWQECMRIQPQ